MNQHEENVVVQTGQSRRNIHEGASKVYIEYFQGVYHVVDDAQVVSKHDAFAEACWVKSVLERDRDESHELMHFESTYTATRLGSFMQI